MYDPPIPEHLKESLDAYADPKRRRPTGDFLRAVLCNDLMGAFGRADETSAAAMRTICRYVYQNLRRDCWGSPRVVDAWLARENPA